MSVFLKTLILILLLTNAIRSPAFEQNYPWIQRQNNCASVPTGKKIIVSATAADSPTLLPINYALTKINAHDYLVEVPILLYKKNRKFGLKFFDHSEELKLKEKILNCTDPKNFYFLGPNNERLYIKALFDLNGMDSQYRKIEQRISVSDVSRPDSHQFSVGMNCATIFHELLHHTGLVDEYQENTFVDKNSASGFAYNCRALGPDSSIMSISDKAIDQYWSIWIRDEITYSIANSSPESIRIDSRFEQNKAHDQDAVIARSIQKLNRILEINIPHFDPKSVQIISHQISNLPKKDKWSGLLPAHFNFITHPGCQELNSTYYTCAVFAYRTGQLGSCKLPPICKTYP